MTDKTARRIARALERIARAIETQAEPPPRPQIPMIKRTNAPIAPSRHRLY